MVLVAYTGSSPFLIIIMKKLMLLFRDDPSLQSRLVDEANAMLVDLDDYVCKRLEIKRREKETCCFDWPSAEQYNPVQRGCYFFAFVVIFRKKKTVIKVFGLNCRSIKIQYY